MADTPNGETATPEVLENNANPPATPVVNASDPAQVEQLRKEAEQAKIRANQLENELKKRQEAEEATKLKQLEEQNEFKTLYEQTTAELNRLREEQTTEQQNKVISEEQAKILAEFPEAVRDIVETTGVRLTDNTDEAKAELTEQLTKISEKLGKDAKVTPNNGQPPSNSVSKDELIRQYRETGDKSAIQAAVNELSFVKPYTQQ